MANFSGLGNKLVIVAISAFISLPAIAESRQLTEDASISAIAESNQSFGILSSLLKLTQLDDVLFEGDFTVFAPTDSAFAVIKPETFQELLQPENRDILEEILQYHVVPGKYTASELESEMLTTLEGSSVDLEINSSGVTVDNATVTQTDIEARNGVIHAIDQVIVPEKTASTLISRFGAAALEPRNPSEFTARKAQTATPTAEAIDKSLLDIASSNDSFTVLTAALKATGLDQTLAADDSYTVFAPTDAAFAALPEGTLELLLKPENREILATILTYHLIPGRVTSERLESGMTPTVAGVPLAVVVDPTLGITVNEAKVIQPDLEASNGVIHIIDRVILPPEQ